MANLGPIALTCLCAIATFGLLVAEAKGREARRRV